MRRRRMEVIARRRWVVVTRVKAVKAKAKAKAKAEAEAEARRRLG
jgi:hypothetical protein